MILDNKKNYIKLILGLKIKQLRLEKQLSLNELAERSQLSVSYLNEIEKGKKYPKVEKIAQLAKALDVNYDHLVSLKLSKNLTPIADLIDSNILEMLPLDHYGININKFIELMSDASYQLSALVATVIDMAKSTEMSQNNFSRTALRIYKEINDNYFDDIEKSVNRFIKEFKLETNPPLKYDALCKILRDSFNYEIDGNRIKDFEELKELRGVVKIGKQSKLYLNPRLSSSQKLFIIGKELAYNYLEIKNRSEIHSSLKLNTFDHLLNNFISAYFSTALMINKDYFIKDINDLFEQDRWNENLIKILIVKYDVSPEMFLQRIANLSGKVWGIKKYFFLRFNGYGNSDVYDLTKEVKLNIKQNPSGYQTSEHYCRRWISIEVLREIKSELNSYSDNHKMKIGILHSKFYDTTDEFLSISIAQQNVLNKNTFTSVTLGFYIDDHLKSRIKFLNDSKIPLRTVNNTCEMCEIGDCKERISEPVTLKRIQKSINIESAIKNL
jgi:transcriptional regulator with XRE-family HTH domain/predicted transcriptional regulator